MKSAPMLDDLLFVNCSVLTMDESRPFADSVAVRGGRILAVGERSEVEALTAPRTRVIDAAGATLMPAFHDSHVHLTQHGFELGQVDLHTAASLQEGLRRVGAAAAQLPPGEWILGAGFALSRWGIDSLDRQMLDRVAPRNPVLLRSQDHHSGWANSLALQFAGIDAASSEPANGTIVRDDSGTPTGLLLERAVTLVALTVPEPDRDDIARALWRAGEDLARRGVATVHHMAYEPNSYWREVALAASREEFPLRVWACVNQEDIEDAAELGVATGQGGDGFQIGGAKFFADGALGSRTAWMKEPYSGGGGSGVAVHGPQVLAERYPLAIAAGLAPVTHAIGDAAVAAVLDALEATAGGWRTKGLRPRVEHVQHACAEDVERLARLGVVASMQPQHLVFDVPAIRTMLPDRLDRAYPIGALLAAGARVAFGSDTPVTRPDVFEGLRAACRREGVDGSVLCAEQAITPVQALRGYTVDAAWAIGREGRSGVLAPGFDADLVLLSGNPTESLDDLAVRGTVKAGRPTFDPEGLLDAGYNRA